MIVQVITLCHHLNGTLQHALAIARSFAELGTRVRLVNLVSLPHPLIEASTNSFDIENIHISPEYLPDADVSIVVGLWEEYGIEAAVRLAHRPGRLILVPTQYWHKNMLRDLKGRAEALWYVSWDQAIEAQPYWQVAERVEVVHCAVDVDRFQPAGRVNSGAPWVLCRHSWDVPSKFSQDILSIPERLEEDHKIVFRMLGAAKVLGEVPDHRVEIYSQDAIDPVRFLQQGDIWFYAHSPYWRETACIAMLEAMACGLPVVVSNTGGMREYLVHGRTGFACVDSEEMVKFTKALLDQPALRLSMALAARQFVQQHHSLKSLGKRIKQLLRINTPTSIGT